MVRKNLRLFMALIFVGSATLATILLTTNNLSTKAADAAACPTTLKTKTPIVLRYASVDTTDVVTSNNTFGIDLYHQLTNDDKTHNLCFSPYSLFHALGMTLAGAKSTTKTQMATVLHIDSLQNYNRNAQHLNAVLTKASGDNITLSIANRLFVQNNGHLLDSFLQTMDRHYGAALQSVDFSDSQKASDTINTWVSGQTNAMVPSLVGPGDLDERTALVLANAVYFKGTWLKPFPQENTYDAPFFVNEATIVDRPIMQQTNTFAYMETNDFQMIEMNYKTNTTAKNVTASPLSMVIMLPKTSDGIFELEGSLSPALLRDSIAKLTATKLVVSVPKFSFDAACNVKGALQNLGMNNAFTRDADFSGMTGTQELYIDKLLHKAMIEVAEEGTKAAATTAVVMTLKSLSPFKGPFPLIFNADHPFLFFIRDKASDTLLFMGRMVNVD